MAKLSRRDLVFTTGALASCAGGLADALSRLDQLAVPDPKSVLQRIRVDGEREAEFVRRVGRSLSPRSSLSLTAGIRTERRREAEVDVRLTAEGEVVAYGLRYQCDARHMNLLCVAGEPLRARRISYSVSHVAWSPAPGLPVYDQACPRYEQRVDSYYPQAKWNQVVPRIGSQFYFSGCQASGVCENPDEAQVAFDVNDSDYTDNAGSYVVTLWSWS
jgi:hypothetical protein